MSSLSWPELAAVAIGAWFIVATVLAVIIGAVLHRNSRHLPGPAAGTCTVCGGTRQLGPDGSCTDEKACTADLDAMLDAHDCGPDCKPYGSA